MIIFIQMQMNHEMFEVDIKVLLCNLRVIYMNTVNFDNRWQQSLFLTIYEAAVLNNRIRHKQYLLMRTLTTLFLRFLLQE